MVKQNPELQNDSVVFSQVCDLRLAIYDAVDSPLTRIGS